MASTVPFLSEGKFIMLGSTWVRKMGFIDVFSDDALAQRCLGPQCPQRMHSHPVPALGFPAPRGWVCGRAGLAWLWCSQKTGSSLHLHHEHMALLFPHV